MTKKTKQPTIDQLTVEQSMQQLEQIVETLESGDVSLEESIALYERGIGLSKHCLQRLNDVEKKLKVLSRSIEGSLDISEDMVDKQPAE